MIKRHTLALMAVAILIGVISLSPVRADTTYTVDFEGLAEGTIVSTLSCDSGISCPGGDPGGFITVRAHNPDIDSGNTNTAMTFNAECIPLVDCTGGDDDLSFPGHGMTLINSADLDSTDPDDLDTFGSFIEFDFTAFAPEGVTVNSIDAGDIEEREIGAFVEGSDGPCTGAETGLDDIPLPITGDNVIQTVEFELSGLRCFLVHLNGSGTIDNIELTVVDQSEPAIDIEKATNGADADGANDPDVPQIAAGGDVIWTYVVTNTGSASLESVLLTDDNGTPGDTSDDFTPTLVSGDDNSDNLLDPDETWTYQAFGLAADLDSAPSGVSLVNGCNPGGTPDRPAFENLAVVTAAGGATDTDPSHYCNSAESALAAIAIEKATNGEDADDPTGPVVPVGSRVDFTYEVTNSGSVDLTNVTVRDDLISVPATGSASAILDFEGLEEGTIVSELNCGAGITCSDGDTNGTVVVRAHNPAIDSGNTNTAMIFNSDCVALVDCAGGDDDLSFPGHGKTLIISEDLDSGDPDDQTNTGSFMEFDFSGFGPGEVTVHSIDTGDIEEREIGAFVQFSDGPCPGVESASEDILIPLTGDNVIETVSFESTGVKCLLVHLNGSGLVDNIRVSTEVPPAPMPVEVSCPQDTLATGETMTCTGSTTATPGQYSNLGTACGVSADGQTVCEDDPSNHFGESSGTDPEPDSAIDIEKWTRIDALPTPGDLCDTFEKPKQLTMLYTGGNVLDHSQDSGKAIVSGDPGFADLVHIVSSEKSDGSGKIYFEGMVNLEERFVIDASRARDDKLKSKTFVLIADQDGNPLQAIEFHTSCSQPLELGNQFGAIQLISLSDKHGASGTFAPAFEFGQDADTPTGPTGQVGDDVVWTYLVRNAGDAPLGDVAVVDDNGTPEDTSDDFRPDLVGGDENGNNLLDLDETWLYQATGEIGAGQYANLGSVSGVDPDGAAVKDQDPGHYFGVCPTSTDHDRGHRKSVEQCGEDSETDDKDESHDRDKDNDRNKRKDEDNRNKKKDEDKGKDQDRKRGDD